MKYNCIALFDKELHYSLRSLYVQSCILVVHNAISLLYYITSKVTEKQTLFAPKWENSIREEREREKKQEINVRNVPFLIEYGM